MISSESGLLHVDVIVLDEVHYLSDISRGTVWEEIVRSFHRPSTLSVSISHWVSSNFWHVLMQVIYCPKEVQLICLSATVANPDELAGWIGQVYGYLKNLNISMPCLRVC